MAQHAETNRPQTGTEAALEPESTGFDIVFLVIFFLVLIGVALVVAGGLLRRSAAGEPGSGPPQEL